MTTQNLLLLLPGRALAPGAAVMIGVAKYSEAGSDIAEGGLDDTEVAVGTVRFNVGPDQIDPSNLVSRDVKNGDHESTWAIYPGEIKGIDLKDGSTYVLDVTIDALAETAAITRSVSFELTAVAEAIAA